MVEADEDAEHEDLLSLSCKNGKGEFAIKYTEWIAQGRGPLSCPRCGTKHHYGQSEIVAANKIGQPPAG
jgi:hypothetical protein